MLLFCFPHQDLFNNMFVLLHFNFMSSGTDKRFLLLVVDSFVILFKRKIQEWR